MGFMNTILQPWNASLYDLRQRRPLAEVVYDECRAGHLVSSSFSGVADGISKPAIVIPPPPFHKY